MARPKKVEPETKEERVVRISRSEERGQSLAQMWEVAGPRIKAMVPQHVNPDRLLAALLTAVNRSPDLGKCTQISLMREAIRAASMGLDISGVGGKAWLVPFWNKDAGVFEAQLIVGYRGLEELARRTGQIAAIWSREVYDGEEFNYRDGMVQEIFHQPQGPRTPDEEPIGAYAVALWSNGFRQGEVMNKIQLDKIRNASKAKNGPAWTGHVGEMYRKTVTRRLCKRLPDSVELAIQLDNEDRMDRGEVPAPTISIDLEPPTALPSAGKKSNTEKLKEQLTREASPTEAPPDDDQTGMFEGEREPGEEG